MQPTSHFCLFSILSVSGWCGKDWLAGPHFSLSSEEGTAEQSRAAPCLRQSTTEKNTTKKARKRRASETVLVCFSSDVDTVWMQLFVFCPVLVLQKQPKKSILQSSKLDLLFVFKKKCDFCFNWSLIVGGKKTEKLKKSQSKWEGDYGCDLAWESGPVFFVCRIRQLCWTATSGTPTQLHSARRKPTRGGGGGKKNMAGQREMGKRKTRKWGMKERRQKERAHCYQM